MNDTKAVIYPVAGVELAAVSAGLYPAKRLDLALLRLSATASVAAVTTRNTFVAAPVLLLREHLKSIHTPRYLLINSAIANAFTGKQGILAATETCRLLAAQTDCAVEQILPFSTGVIGGPLPVEKISAQMPRLLAGLDAENWQPAAQAIMTTDTCSKLYSTRFSIAGKVYTLTGMAKGSGMIHPNMATMLCFLATDVTASKAILQSVLNEAVATSFNCISVDGDTSTNDACVLIATGKQSTSPPQSPDDAACIELRTALTAACQNLAQQIVRDGEGASKFVEIVVAGGDTHAQCHEIANAIATSPLVKTALGASDANWGRILAAIGKCNAAQRIDPQQISLFLAHVCVIAKGEPCPEYTEEQGQKVMSEQDIRIRVVIGAGDASACVWTCDLSAEYVRINADYRS